jgi:hypothetical protein
VYFQTAPARKRSPSDADGRNEYYTCCVFARASFAPHVGAVIRGVVGQFFGHRKSNRRHSSEFLTFKGNSDCPSRRDTEHKKEARAAVLGRNDVL